MTLADQYIDARNMDGARQVLLRIVEAGPDAEAYVKLSYLESACSNHVLANRYASEALALQPTDPQTSLRLMNRLRHFNESEALHDYISRSPHLRSGGPQLVNAVAAHLSSLEEHHRARDAFDALVRLQPRNPRAYVARAQIHMFLGDFERSRQDLDACIALAPGMGQAWLTLSQVRRATPGDNSVDTLRRMLSDPTMPADNKAYLAFALHKELDDLGDHAGAGEALSLGCTLRRPTQAYSDAGSRHLFESLAAVERWPTPPADAHAHGFTPVFIVGMFRSGTTLLERLVAGSPLVRSGGELRDVSSGLQYAADHACKTIIDQGIVDASSAIDYASFGKRYLDKVQWRLRGKTFLTDKMPPNFLGIGYILGSIPGAKVLHMVRDPVATCFSNLREHFSGMSPYSYDQIELADYFARYRRLMAHWHATFPGQILDVSYDRLTSDTEATMRQVAAFCGLDFVPDMLDPRSGSSGVATASAVQVRAPVTRRAVEKWEPYREYLSPLISRLEASGVEVARPGGGAPTP